MSDHRSALLTLGVAELPPMAFMPRPDGKMTLEGSKGSSAPPPDPRLVEAQIKSMGIQDEAIQGIMENTRTLQPLQAEQMRLGIDAARRAQDESSADREWMLGRRNLLSGMQDRLIDDASSFNTEDRRAQLAGQALGDVNQAFSNARDQGGRSLARMGVNPNDGKFAAMQNQTGIAQAAAMAGAANKAREAARQEGYALTDRASNALAGYPAMGMQATGAGAGYGMAGLNVANQGLAGLNGGFGAAGTMAGQMGANATGMFNAQAQYKTAADRAAADANPLGALLGAGAQLGSAAIGAGLL